ncbi:hypothetical protein [Streptomyces melanogenes]|uniref:hypothetical protein n=1 Tax=Streptomyces melanogenes TaxID=67326 RepID=UPI00167E1C1B|nr:hypothetical protein [Streptomyces melanogenes]GGP94057.1 hypothetical protein GCM10010278_85050 [Streptomyces melanogenes]
MEALDFDWSDIETFVTNWFNDGDRRRGGLVRALSHQRGLRYLPEEDLLDRIARFLPTIDLLPADILCTPTASASTHPVEERGCRGGIEREAALAPAPAQGGPACR